MNILNHRLPKFELVRRELEERIRNGEYRHGDRLPPEEELASFFAVGRNTIRKAVQVLLDTGLVTKQQGRVSRINCPDGSCEHRPASRLAWFTGHKVSDANSNIIYYEIFKAFVREAANRGLQLDFYPVDSMYALQGWSKFEENIDRYVGMFCCGIREENLSPGMAERLYSLNNLIAIDDVDDPPARHLVSVDNYAGGKLAAEHILQCKCRNVCMFLPDNNTKAFEERLRGFEDAVKQAPEVDFDIIRFKFNHGQDYFEVVEKHWPEIMKHDAVFSYCDDVANSILLAAGYHNCPIPGKLSLVGFDGMEVVRHLQPPMTTIQQPIQEVAEAAINLAGELYEKPTDSPRRIFLGGKLISGGTTRIIRNSDRKVRKYVK